MIFFFCIENFCFVYESILFLFLLYIFYRCRYICIVIIIIVIIFIIIIITMHMSLCYYTTMPPGVASLEDILASLLYRTHGAVLCSRLGAAALLTGNKM